MDRRFAAILTADLISYSRLMGADGAGTLARLKAFRKKLVQPKITKCKERIVKLMDDGLLAEFPSIVEPVGCTVAIQEEMADRETSLPDEHRIRVRIGVNIGDIIGESSDICGDRMNVAARLEGLASLAGNAFPMRSSTLSRATSTFRSEILAPSRSRTSQSSRTPTG